MSDLYLLMSDLASRGSGDVDLRNLRSGLPDLTDAQLWTRCLLYSQQLGIPEGAELHVAAALAEKLAEAGDLEGLPRMLLLAAIRKSSKGRDDNHEVLTQYRQRLWRHLSRSVTGHLTDDDLEAVENPDAAAPHWLTPLLVTWPNEILNSPAWSRIESPVPGVPDLPIQKAWVDLSLKEISATDLPTLDELKQSASRELNFDHQGGGYSLVEVLLGVKDLNVVIGLPGAGKSTLVRWLARHIIETSDCPFGIPAVISLRHFARAKETQPSLRLQDYFFQSRCQNPEDEMKWHGIAAGLLDPPEETWDSVETFLWLLDGWDEVPVHMRDSVMEDIRSIAVYPAIVTSRQSGGPMHLPATRFFEVQGLQHGAALELAYKWLIHTDRSAYYGGIVTALDAPDLRRMARSPFLLTLFCALYSAPRGTAKIPPSKRSEILAEVIRLVYEHHNGDTKQNRRFTELDKRQIAEFAFWLLVDAPEAPQYVFDGGDYEISGASAATFEELLVPSRLVAQPLVDIASFQFLHASFQEFLGATFLERNPEKLPPDGQAITNPAWKEMMRLLAERAGPESLAAQRLWEDARRISKTLDRFGIIASKLAVLVASAGVRDGGQGLLGIDLRDRLWEVIEEYAADVPKPLIDAFLELDSQDFARRVLDHRIRIGTNDIVVSWLALLTVFDLEMLVSDQEQYRRILSLPEVLSFCPSASDLASLDGRPEPKELRRLRAAVLKSDIESAQAILYAAVPVGDEDVLELMMNEIVKLGSEKAAELLLPFIENAEGVGAVQSLAMNYIARLGDRASRQRIMRLLAGCVPGDPRILLIVGSLTDNGIHLDQREAALILEFVISSPDPEVRMAAAQLAATTRSKVVPKLILAACEKESEDAVRISFFYSLRDLADEALLPYLWEKKEEVLSRAPEVQAAWCDALLTTLRIAERKTRPFPHESWSDVFIAIEQWAALTAQSRTTKDTLLQVIFQFPDSLGTGAETVLAKAVDNTELSERTRSTALQSLAKITTPSTVDFVVKVAGNDGTHYSDLLLRTACESLGQMRPAMLGDLKSPIASSTMAQLAFRYEILFMKNGVRSANGSVMNKTTTLEQAASIVPALPPVDIAIFIALKEELKHFRKFIESRYKIAWSLEDHPTKALTFHRCLLTVPETSVRASIAVVCPEEMGLERAANVMSAMLERYAPTSVVVIGIAGAISDDIRLADIVIPNEIWSYLANTAADDSADKHPDFKAAGNHFRADAHLLNQVRQAGIRFPSLHNAWRSRCGRRLTVALKEFAASPSPFETITRPHPQVFEGDHHLATGPSVARSEALAKWILSHDRKTAAVEMESAAVFDAVETEIRTRRAIALRGISDFGDSRKSSVEKTYKGAFRRVSMLNAIDYLCLLIETGVFARGNQP